MNCRPCESLGSSVFALTPAARHWRSSVPAYGLSFGGANGRAVMDHVSNLGGGANATYCLPFSYLLATVGGKVENGSLRTPRGKIINHAASKDNNRTASITIRDTKKTAGTDFAVELAIVIKNRCTDTAVCVYNVVFSILA